jgi:hypothetical protein
MNELQLDVLKGSDNVVCHLFNLWLISLIGPTGYEEMNGISL